MVPKTFNLWGRRLNPLQDWISFPTCRIGAGTNTSCRSAPGASSSWSTSSTIDLYDYFTFTIAPQAGFEIDYSDFIYIGQRSTSGPTTFSFRTSVHGFIAEFGTPVA